MKFRITDHKDVWQKVKDLTMTTIGLNTGKYPTSEWKRKLLLSEHSPIRKLTLDGKWNDLKYWVSVHMVRHKFGIDHMVSTQRTDRTGINRDDKKQGDLVDHSFTANAQAIINISRKRLCTCASKETREAWIEVIKEIEKVEPELASVCVRECVYRNGFCPEMFSCGYTETEMCKEEVEKYTGIKWER